MGPPLNFNFAGWVQNNRIHGLNQWLYLRLYIHGANQLLQHRHSLTAFSASKATKVNLVARGHCMGLM